MHSHTTKLNVTVNIPYKTLRLLQVVANEKKINVSTLIEEILLAQINERPTESTPPD